MVTEQKAICPLQKATEDRFVSAVRPKLIAMLAVQERLERMSLCTTDGVELMNMLDAIEASEHEVMLAWARATEDINPGMTKDVELGRTKMSLSTKRYLLRVVEIEPLPAPSEASLCKNERR